jgi:regulator of PEP synthase PpsR (kinase-PPPase family)
MRTVFYISDRTAITAEALGHCLLVQFEGVKYHEITMPYVDCRDKVEAVVKRINLIASQDVEKPVVFTTLVDPLMRKIIGNCNALVLDPFNIFLRPLETEFKTSPLHETGRSRRISDSEDYDIRIDAINFTLAHDDGTSTAHYDRCDIILTGVSRCGKTPTCLYLALQFGIRAANYPLTEEVLNGEVLPAPLRAHSNKLFGLTSDPHRLHNIRSERRPRSQYASWEQCRFELRAAEGLFRAYNIPYLNTTTHSIEEIATRIVHNRGLQRRYY